MVLGLTATRDNSATDAQRVVSNEVLPNSSMFPVKLCIHLEITCHECANKGICFSSGLKFEASWHLVFGSDLRVRLQGFGDFLTEELTIMKSEREHNCFYIYSETTIVIMW